MVETNLRRKIMELLREHLMEPVDRERIEAYYFNTTSFDD